MREYNVTVEGMMCENCEKHVNDAVKKAFRPKSVVSSHENGTTVIISKKELSQEEIKEVIENTGFTVKEIISKEV